MRISVFFIVILGLASSQPISDDVPVPDTIEKLLSVNPDENDILEENTPERKGEDFIRNDGSSSETQDKNTDQYEQTTEVTSKSENDKAEPQKDTQNDNQNSHLNNRQSIDHITSKIHQKTLANEENLEPLIDVPSNAGNSEPVIPLWQSQIKTTGNQEDESPSILENNETSKEKFHDGDVKQYDSGMTWEILPAVSFSDDMVNNNAGSEHMQLPAEQIGKNIFESTLEFIPPDSDYMGASNNFRQNEASEELTQSLEEAYELEKAEASFEDSEPLSEDDSAGGLDTEIEVTNSNMDLPVLAVKQNTFMVDKGAETMENPFLISNPIEEPQIGPQEILMIEGQLQTDLPSPFMGMQDDFGMPFGNEEANIYMINNEASNDVLPPSFDANSAFRPFANELPVSATFDQRQPLLPFRTTAPFGDESLLSTDENSGGLLSIYNKPINAVQAMAIHKADDDSIMPLEIEAEHKHYEDEVFHTDFAELDPDLPEPYQPLLMDEEYFQKKPTLPFNQENQFYFQQEEVSNLRKPVVLLDEESDPSVSVFPIIVPEVSLSPLRPHYHPGINIPPAVWFHPHNQPIAPSVYQVRGISKYQPSYQQQQEIFFPKEDWPGHNMPVFLSKIPEQPKKKFSPPKDLQSTNAERTYLEEQNDSNQLNSHEDFTSVIENNVKETAVTEDTNSPATFNNIKEMEDKLIDALHKPSVPPVPLINTQHGSIHNPSAPFPPNDYFRHRPQSSLYGISNSQLQPMHAMNPPSYFGYNFQRPPFNPLNRQNPNAFTHYHPSFTPQSYRRGVSINPFPASSPLPNFSNYRRQPFLDYLDDYDEARYDDSSDYDDDHTHSFYDDHPHNFPGPQSQYYQQPNIGYKSHQAFQHQNYFPPLYYNGPMAGW